MANNPASFVDEYGLSVSSMAQAFVRGMWDGAFSLDGAKALIEAAVVASATAFLMGSCFPVIQLLTFVASVVGGAIGVAGFVKSVMDIIQSDLCPDQKAYEVGKKIGVMIAGLVGGIAGAKFGPKNTGCFVAGTLVAMADGTQKKIEDVRAGDWVLSKDEQTGQVEKKQVENNTVKYVSQTLLLTFSDGSQVETTEEHPLYVDGQGFKAAKGVGIGTSIVTRAGPSLQVTKIEPLEKGTLVYNLTVEGFHTYFVGSGLWVHNTGPNCGGGGGDGDPPPKSPENPVERVDPNELVETHNLTNSNKSLRKLTADIRENGIQDPVKYVLHNGRKYIVDGHHRTWIAKGEGIQVPVQRVELPFGGYKTVADLDYTHY